MRKRESNKQPDSPKVLMTVRVLEEGCTTFVKEWMKADEITGIVLYKKVVDFDFSHILVQ